MQKAQKTEFKYTPPSFGTIEAAGRVYTASAIGPLNFCDLRLSNYGKGFRQATFGELLDLVYESYFNQGNEGACKVVEVAKEYLLSGNTSVIYTPELVIVQDMPRIDKNWAIMTVNGMTNDGKPVENGGIIMNPRNLIAKLSKSANKGVKFSDDGTIRALPYGFETGFQTLEKMVDNPFPIALTGDLKAPVKLAQIEQERQHLRGFIWALDEGTKNKIRVPVLDVLSEYGIGASWNGYDKQGHSFGVLENS